MKIGGDPPKIEKIVEYCQEKDAQPLHTFLLVYSIFCSQIILHIELTLVADLIGSGNVEEIAKKLLTCVRRRAIFVLATWSKMDLSNSISCAI